MTFPTLTAREYPTMGSHFDPVEMFWRFMAPPLWMRPAGELRTDPSDPLVPGADLPSMLKMPHPGEDHRDVALARDPDHLLVADRPSRLDHRDRSGVQAGFEGVGKGEEGVARDHRAL